MGLPPRRFPESPSRSGGRRRALSAERIQGPVSHRGRSGRSPSASPESPSWSDRQTPCWTARAESRAFDPPAWPSCSELRGAVPWSRWSWWDPPRRRLSSWEESTACSASGPVRGRMGPRGPEAPRHSQLFITLRLVPDPGGPGLADELPVPFAQEERHRVAGVRRGKVVPRRRARAALRVRGVLGPRTSQDPASRVLGLAGGSTHRSGIASRRS